MIYFHHRYYRIDTILCNLIISQEFSIMIKFTHNSNENSLNTKVQLPQFWNSRITWNKQNTKILQLCFWINLNTLMQNTSISFFFFFVFVWKLEQRTFLEWNGKRKQPTNFVKEIDFQLRTNNFVNDSSERNPHSLRVLLIGLAPLQNERTYTNTRNAFCHRRLRRHPYRHHQSDVIICITYIYRVRFRKDFCEKEELI